MDLDSTNGTFINVSLLTTHSELFFACPVLLDECCSRILLIFVYTYALYLSNCVFCMCRIVALNLDVIMNFSKKILLNLVIVGMTSGFHRIDT